MEYFMDYKIKKEFRIIKDNYKKMFHSGTKEFGFLWETYADLFYDMKQIGLDIPDEMDYPFNLDFFITDTGYNNYTQYCKDKLIEFNKMMEEMIVTVEKILEERDAEEGGGNHKMNRREKNIRIFNDTIEMVNENDKLLQSITNTLNAQKLILENDEVVVPDLAGDKDAKIIVSGKRTLEAASSYSDKKVCVLNFASATNPGGGVEHGSSAQEESLCRCSTLYFALISDKNNELKQSFYIPHRKANNPLYNDDIIYSPDVYVVKSDTSSPERMNESDWYKVNVITCAAPNLRSKPSNEINSNAGDQPANISDDELEKLLEKRIRRIVSVAAAEGNEVLILGAFGCGAFRNPPQIVAKAFHKVVAEFQKHFEVIEFAIFHTEYETENFKAFKREFDVESR